MHGEAKPLGMISCRWFNRPIPLRKESPYFELYVRFHTDTLNELNCDAAKSLLHHIHYGNVDTTEADAEVYRRRQENNDGREM